MRAGRRPPRPQPGRRRADHGDPPRLRLAARPGRVGHRPPGLRPQDAHRTGRGVRPAAGRGRAERLPEPGRVAARPRREQPRVHLAELRRRAGQGLRDPRRGPARRHRDRRRGAHRRHGLGGAQQHRRREEVAAGDRRQRQRPLLHADGRRPHHRAHHAAHQPALRADARRRQAAAQRRAGRRAGGVRRPARDEEGRQGRRRSPGALRGPRAEVRRAGRRPRPGGGRARAGPGEEVQRPGDRARDHPQGVRLRRRGAPRGRPVPPGRAVRPRLGRAGPQGQHLDQRVHRRDREDRPAPPGRRGDHRGDDAPGRAAPVPGPVPRAHLRRRHRRAARHDLRGRPRHGWAAPGGRDLRDLPQPRLRPGADGLRAAPVRGHLRARPGRRDR